MNGIRAFVFVLLGASVALPMCPPACGSAVRAGTAEESDWVTMPRTAAGEISLPVQIDGRDFVSIVDSGSTPERMGGISSRLLNDLKADVIGSDLLSGYGGRTYLKVVRIPRIKIGGLVFENAEFDVHPGDRPPFDRIDIILGLSFLNKAVIQIDWGNNRALVKRSIYNKRIDSSDIYRSQFLQIPVQLCGERFNFIVDTGHNGDGILGTSRNIVERCGNPKQTDMRSFGIGGPRIKSVYNLHPVSIAGREIGDALFKVESADDPLSRMRIAGSIGSNMLARLNFVLDAGNNSLDFYGDKLKSYNQRPTIGIQFSLASDKILVTHIMKNSPASFSALRVGDQICAINGQSVGKGRDMRMMNPSAGTRIVVSTCSGSSIVLTALDFLGDNRVHP